MSFRVVHRVLLSIALFGASLIGLPAEKAQAAVVSPPLGVYRWDAPTGPANVDEYSAWLGSDVMLAEAFEAKDTWDDIDGQGWQLNPWTAWLKAKPGRKLILGVPMLPGDWNRNGATSGPGPLGPVSLETGATGAYNAAFLRLAQDLVNRGIGDQVYLRPGHEFNGGWYSWRAGGHEAAYAEYWRQIVNTMRSVPGQNFKFVWNPTIGNEVDFVAAYPGNAYVDYIGLDVYDGSWTANTYPIPAGSTDAEILARRQRAWEGTLNGWYGISFFEAFAKARGMAFSFPEWGTWTR